MRKTARPRSIHGKRLPPARSWLRLKACRQRVGTAAQQQHVHAHATNKAPWWMQLCTRSGCGHQNARRLATSAHPLQRIIDDELHIGVAGVAGIAQAGRQIGRANEDAVNAIHLAISSRWTQGIARFHLHQQAISSAPRCTAASRPKVGSAHAAAHTAHPMGGIAHRLTAASGAAPRFAQGAANSVCAPMSR